MKKVILVLTLSAFTGLFSLLAKAKDTQVTSPAKKTPVASAKQEPSAATQEEVVRPIQPGNSILGFRVGQGDAFEGKLSGGLNYEYLYNQLFGINLGFYYAGYKVQVALNNTNVESNTKAYTLVAMGNIHPSFVKVPNLDLFVSLGVGHSFVRGKTEVAGISNNVTTKADTTFLVGTGNIRYFLDPNLALVGSLGFGLSTFTFGLDYKF